MTYDKLLAAAVKESGWSLAEIALRCKRHGLTIDRTYISKLCTGKKPPASDKANKALASVLSPVSNLTYENLRLSAYKAAIPKDVQEALARAIVQENLQEAPHEKAEYSS